MEKVDDIKAYIWDKFAIVVRDAELAKRLGVGHMTWEETLDFLKRPRSMQVNI